MIWRCTSTKWFFVYLIPGRTGIFLRRGENLSEQIEKQQQTQTRYFGVEAGTWWEASALTAAPSLAIPVLHFLVQHTVN